VRSALFGQSALFIGQPARLSPPVFHKTLIKSIRFVSGIFLAYNSKRGESVLTDAEGEQWQIFFWLKMTGISA
jgi:hypothetical protein